MEQFNCWMAGFVDGDGCFTISMTLSKSKNKSILITPQVRIGVKGNDSKYMYLIQKTTGLGKVYWSNKGKVNEVCSWQTTNLKASISITKMLLPYLMIKKDKAQKFLNIAEFWKNTMKPLGGNSRPLGIKLRTKEEMIKIVKTSIGLNYDRQVKRYREKKGWGYWQKIIEELY